MQGFDPWSGNQDPTCCMALAKKKKKKKKPKTTHQNKQTKTRERGPKVPSCPPGGSPCCCEKDAPYRSWLVPSPHFATTMANITSGVHVADEVCCIFYDRKVQKCLRPEEIKKRKKAVNFCLSVDKKCLIMEEGKEILVGDVGVTKSDPFKHFVGMLPEKDCWYALYDTGFETKESRKEELMFFL